MRSFESRSGARKSSAWAKLGVERVAANETGDRLVVPVERNERHAAVHPIRDRIRRQCQSPVVAVERLGIAADLAQNVGAIGVRRREIGRKRDGAVETRQGVVVQSERVQGAAQDDMAARLLRIAVERLAGELRALLEAAVLAGNQRQIIKRVRIGRIGAQNFGVARGGFVDGAAPVQRQAFLQQIAYGGDGHSR